MIVNDELYREAILIRYVEEALLDSFSKGLLNGTIHTCIGQEFSALAFCKQIRKSDFIFSNHRCHGHYIAYTGDYFGIIAEVFGKKSGICGGVGGSQHLCKNNFFSNGVQGGILPLAAGMAFAEKLKINENIGLVFIGDGTMGEGIVYETLNIVSKWKIPLLIVLENNYYAQSTPQRLSLAGDIPRKAQSFDIEVFEDSTEDVEKLVRNAKNSIDFVRERREPAFHIVDTYRLAPHSKGDDFRDPAEIETYRKKDPINIFSQNNPELYGKLLSDATKEIQNAIASIKEHQAQTLLEYYEDLTSSALSGPPEWIENQIYPSHERYINRLNAAFITLMDRYEDIVFMGEDILSPYGGAFKATKDLSIKYPKRVYTTPISEAAITGIANGLAMKGYRPFLEIMFGDFITLTLDQLVNHASKFYFMYNKQVKCPIVLRTPMGGRRGYGPTHSQSIEKLLIGLDNVKVIALNTFFEPIEVYENIYKNEKHPVIVIENKLDYARIFSKIDIANFENFSFERSNSVYPIIRAFPVLSKPDVSIITYGGAMHDAFKAMELLFYEKEILSELIILTQIHPIYIDELSSAIHTEYVFTVEEGSRFSGFGSEIIASLVEHNQSIKKSKRIGSLPLPIPSSKELETEVLCNYSTIASTICEVIYGC